MKKIKLSCGFEAEINENVIKDYRFIRLIKKLTRAADYEESAYCFDDLIVFMLGEEQAEALIEHIAKEDGYADPDKIDAALTEAFEILSKEDEDVKK